MNRSSSRLVAVATVLLVILLAAAAAVLLRRAGGPSAVGPDASATPPATRPASPTPASPSPTPTPTRFGVGLRVLTFVDRSREIEPSHTVTGEPEPRTLKTYIWYPTLPAGGGPRRRAAPATAEGRFPLLLFAAGFDLYPTAYAPMLVAFVRAGYVVAAPVFPLTNPGTPGGPDERDIVNQPADMSFVLTRVLALDHRPPSFLYRLVAPSEVAAAGQSDGGDTVLAAAYSSCCRDPRIRAAIVMSGQQLLPGTYYGPGSPPMLATQGTADPINPPALTAQLFAAASRPKWLLTLAGADHLAPYTSRTPWERVVVRVSLDFLDHYLLGTPGTLSRMRAAGNVPGVADLRR